jgi:DNA-binding beta-propeller fold protein YncE
MRFLRHRVRTFAAIAPAIVLGACASGPVEFLRRPTKPVQWPPAEASARVRVEFAYAGAQDVETHPGFFRRLVDAIVGDERTEFVSPCGIASAQQTLFVADTGSACVHRIDLQTGEHEVWRGSDDFALEMPVGIAVGEQSAVYVADSSRGRIVEFRDGEPVRAIGEGRLHRPTGLCWDAARHRLLVVDTTAARIVAFSANGEELASTGTRGAEPGAFNYPTHIAVARDGIVAVSDSMNFRVQLLSSELQHVRTIGQVGRGPGSFASPKGVAFDPDGHVWVVDGLFENVQLFDRDGTLLLAVGTGGRGIGELTLPTGICIAPDGLVVLADAGNSRIQVLRYETKP